MVMVITGRGRYATVDVNGWSAKDIEAVSMSVEIDGYSTRIEAIA